MAKPFMHDCSKDIPFSHILSSRIRKVLDKVDIPRLENQYSEMMLWILIMGCLSGSPPVFSVVFVVRILLYSRVRDITTI